VSLNWLLRPCGPPRGRSLLWTPPLNSWGLRPLAPLGEEKRGNIVLPAGQHTHRPVRPRSLLWAPPLNSWGLRPLGLSRRRETNKERFYRRKHTHRPVGRHSLINEGSPSKTNGPVRTVPPLKLKDLRPLPHRNFKCNGVARSSPQANIHMGL